MNGAELSKLVDLRWDALNELLDLGAIQAAAIQAGHMTELMRVLSEKQKPVQRLVEISAMIREAVDDDPERRQWPNQAAREACRQRQAECEGMHKELLALEADLEANLQKARSGIQERLQQMDNAHLAASSYAQSQATGSQPVATSGGQLDLSSDS